MTQSSVAISGDGKDWVLVNASPDLTWQIEAFSPLQPKSNSPRNSPVASVCLTNSDIDHALGLLAMRQGEQPLMVYASAPVQTELQWLDGLVRRFRKLEWRQPPRDFQSLHRELEFRALELETGLAYVFRDRATKKSALVAPAIASLNPDLIGAMQEAAAILLDGTFWSNDELGAFRPNARTSHEMKHIPVKESLAQMERSPARRKIYMHINNTNPILQPHSRERREVERAGVVVGCDGLEFEL